MSSQLCFHNGDKCRDLPCISAPKTPKALSEHKRIFWAFWRHLSVELLDRLGLASYFLQIMYPLYYLCYFTSCQVTLKVAFKSLCCKHIANATVWWYCRQTAFFFREKSKLVISFEQHRFCLQYHPVLGWKKLDFMGCFLGNEGSVSETFQICD